MVFCSRPSHAIVARTMKKTTAQRLWSVIAALVVVSMVLSLVMYGLRF